MSGRRSGSGRIRAALLAAAVSSLIAVAGARAQDSGAGSGGGFGRLFTTPQQRAALDEMRREHEFGQPVRKAQETAPAVQAVTVNGVVIRSSGHNATWINGSPLYGGHDTPEGVRVETGGAAGTDVRIVLPGAPQTVELKPGQKIDIPDGRVMDAWQHARVPAPGAAFEKGGAPSPQQPPEPPVRPATGGGDG